MVLKWVLVEEDQLLGDRSDMTKWDNVERNAWTVGLRRAEQLLSANWYAGMKQAHLVMPKHNEQKFTITELQNRQPPT